MKVQGIYKFLKLLNKEIMIFVLNCEMQVTLCKSVNIFRNLLFVIGISTLTIKSYTTVLCLMSHDVFDPF